MNKIYLRELKVEDAIRRLRAGEVVKHDGGIYETKIIDGFLCNVSPDGDFEICSKLSSQMHISAYFESQEPLNLEVGKPYRTRNGNKAIISQEKEGATYPMKGVILGFGNIDQWKRNGKYDEDVEEHDFDIIGGWIDDE